MACFTHGEWIIASCSPTIQKKGELLLAGTCWLFWQRKKGGL
jgi:hypothetical protein